MNIGASTLILAMAEVKPPKVNWNRKCTLCDVNFCAKNAYVLHLLGKRHQKNVKKRDRNQVNAVRNKTVCLTGKRDKVPLEKIVGYFLEYGVNSVTHYPNTVFIEFDTAEVAQIVLQKRYCRIRTASLRISPMKPKFQDEDRKVPISPSLKARMSQAVTGIQLDKHISFLIKEIELKPHEVDARESLRRGIANYLSPYFPQVLGHIFGSSANNLGFTGCDVDIYLDIGVYPWLTCETKAAAQAQASDITWFISSKIRQSGKAFKVEAVPRARVPIVKFQDRSSRIMVDLSFRHAMPVYNTQLINQYTKTHPLVRPYLMVIRYWAKVQGVAGGGKPSFLITNYALTMMMLFYLMCRKDSIVPSVSALRDNKANYKPIFIGPWDVAFSTSVSEWCSKIHNVNVMDLVSEFFSFYGELEASKWVISPLVGELLARKDVQSKSENLPQCFNTYLQQDDVIQLETELCVQDPFEHSHNCTRGLIKSSFLEFQYKCRTAASISSNILKGEQTLNDLFEPIEITPDMISDMCQSSSESKEDEVITLDDSDTSQDIEVLDTHKRQADDKVLPNSEGTLDIEILPCPERTLDVEILPNAQEAEQDIEILTPLQGTAHFSNNPRKRSNEESESFIKVNDQSEIQSDSSVEILKDGKNVFKEVKIDLSSSKGEGSGVSPVKMENTDTSHPVVLSQLNNCSTFLLDYSQVPEFTITLDGNVQGKGSKLIKEYEIGQAACLFIQFVLQQCLKTELTVVENCPTNRKREALVQDEETTTEKHKKEKDGSSMSVPAKYLKLTKFMCLATLALWNGRKKISKTVARRYNETPLQYELAVTGAQIGMHSYLLGNNSLKFIIEVWQELDNPKMIHVTGNSLCDTKITQSQMIPMFSYFSSLCQNLLKKLTHYVKTNNQ